MKCGIENIDKSIDFPDKGIVSITGNSGIYQMSLIKQIIKNISPSYSNSMVISSHYAYWTTRDFATEAPKTGILEISQSEIYGTLRNIAASDDFKKFPLVAVDAVNARVTMTDVIAFKKFIQILKNKLTIVNCIDDSENKNYDLKKLLLESSLLTLKVEEKRNGNTSNVNISLYQSKK